MIPMKRDVWRGVTVVLLVVALAGCSSSSETSSSTSTRQGLASATTTETPASTGAGAECSDPTGDVISTTLDLNNLGDPDTPAPEVRTGDPGYVDIVSASIQREAGGDAVVTLVVGAPILLSMPPENDSILYSAIVGPADDPLNNGYLLGVELGPDGWQLYVSAFSGAGQTNLPTQPTITGSTVSARFPADALEGLNSPDLAWSAGIETTVYADPDGIVSTDLHDACGDGIDTETDTGSFQPLGS